MFGKHPRMTSLASRKQLLIAESELNRAQLVQEWQTLAGEVQVLTSQARTISALASSAVSLISGLTAIGHKKSVPTAEKTSWWQTILKGAGLVVSLWSEYGRLKRDRTES